MPDEELELSPAKISDRIIAFLLDIAPFLLGWAANVYVVVVLLRAAEFGPDLLRRLGAVWLGLAFLYQFAGNVLGATVGKSLMGLRVLRRDGRPLGVPRGFLRAAGYLISMPFFNLGFLLALANSQSRALDDIVSGAIVVESRPKNPAEAAVLFLGAACSIVALFGGNIYFQLSRPLPSDLLAVDKARQGLDILVGVEEAYKSQHGRYTDSLSELAQASGDVEEFKKALSEIFDPNLFTIELGMKGGYRISAAAKDKDKTRVSILR